MSLVHESLSSADAARKSTLNELASSCWLTTSLKARLQLSEDELGALKKSMSMKGNSKRMNTLEQRLCNIVQDSQYDKEGTISTVKDVK